MMNPNVATNCPLGFGDYYPADTTRAITVDSTMVGNIYYSIGMGTGSKQTQKPRLVMIAKNNSGSTLSRNLVVAYDTAATSFPGLIAGYAAANSNVVAGVIEDGYVAGVPTGALFRLVVKGFHYCQYATASDSQVTTVLGTPLVASGSGEVYGWDNSVAAGAATFAQIAAVMGFSAEVTTNTTDNGLQKLIYVKTSFA